MALEEKMAGGRSGKMKMLTKEQISGSDSMRASGGIYYADSRIVAAGAAQKGYAQPGRGNWGEMSRRCLKM